VHPIESYTLPPDKLLLAVNYAFARHVLYFSSVAFSAIVLVALIRLRIAARLRAWPLPLVVAVVYTIMIVFDLPAAVCAHALSLHYGIGIQRWPGWFADWSKEQALALGVTTLVVWGFYVLLRRSPKRWWLYAWAACVPLIVFAAWIEPYAVEPLFNQFEPLAKQHPELIAPIESLLHRTGVSIPSDHLFEMKASAKTNALNAYVSGFGSSKRVVLYDTIIRKEPEPELMTTFGHELGHYVLGHIAKGIAYASALLLVGFYLAYRIIRAFVSRPEDPESLPLFALILLLLSFLGEPIGNAYSRYQEHQADVYSLEVTKGIVPDNGQAAARAFQIEGETDLEPPDPSPFIVFWLYTHPPVRDRIRFAVAQVSRPVHLLREDEPRTHPVPARFRNRVHHHSVRTGQVSRPCAVHGPIESTEAPLRHELIAIPMRLGRDRQAQRHLVAAFGAVALQFNGRREDRGIAHAGSHIVVPSSVDPDDRLPMIDRFHETCRNLFRAVAWIQVPAPREIRLRRSSESAGSTS
jgi:STE24 endopeptidase